MFACVLKQYLYASTVQVLVCNSGVNCVYNVCEKEWLLKGMLLPDCSDLCGHVDNNDAMSVK